MKKIMFNDKYGLTQAVLDGRKTMTRRIIHDENIPDDPEYGYAPNIDACCVFNEDDVVAKSQYNLCEVVSIAQSYETLANSGYLDKMMDGLLSMKKEYAGAGYKNKMFVKAELMPHHIKITHIYVERLQDISYEDCLREGVRKWDKDGNPLGPSYDFVNSPHGYATPREAFAALIDKVSGRGTWDSNPMVWVYEFELVD
jgi:hypothetical protein